MQTNNAQPSNAARDRISQMHAILRSDLTKFKWASLIALALYCAAYLFGPIDGWKFLVFANVAGIYVILISNGNDLYERMVELQEAVLPQLREEIKESVRANDELFEEIADLLRKKDEDKPRS